MNPARCAGVTLAAWFIAFASSADPLTPRPCSLGPPEIEARDAKLVAGLWQTPQLPSEAPSQLDDILARHRSVTRNESCDGQLRVKSGEPADAEAAEFAAAANLVGGATKASHLGVETHVEVSYIVRASALRARLFRLAGEDAEAQLVLQRGFDIAPYDFDLTAEKAVLLKRLGDTEAAVAAVRAVLDHWPDRQPYGQRKLALKRALFRRTGP